MAFRLKSRLDGYEFRGIQSGVSASTGKAWMNVVLEDPEDMQQVSARVPADMQQHVYDLHLQRGTAVTCEVVGIAGADYSYINLLTLPLPSDYVDTEGADF